jgi:hypothetical protein
MVRLRPPVPAILSFGHPAAYQLEVLEDEPFVA